MGKQTNTAVMVAIIAAVGIGGYALYRSMKGEPVFAAGGSEGQGGFFDLLGISGPPGEANSEQLPALVTGKEGQEGKVPPLTFTEEEAAVLEVMIPAVSEAGNSLYRERDIGNVLGWTPEIFTQRLAAYRTGSETSIGLTAQERYAFGYADTMELARRQEASIERVYELGGSYERIYSPTGVSTILMAPSDFPGSGAQWLKQARAAGLFDEPTAPVSTSTSPINTKSEDRVISVAPSGDNYRNVYSGGGDVMAHFRSYG